MLNKIIALSLYLFLAQSIFAFGEPQHSSIIVKKSFAKDGSVSIELKVKPDEKHKITLDAPWQLEIKKQEGVNFSKKVYKKSELDEKLPGFKITSEKKAKKNGTIKYDLTSFVCTEDKTRCYREVHKNTIKLEK